MRQVEITRRRFLGTAAAAALFGSCARSQARPIVSIVRIRNGKTDAGVEEAIDLLGGIQSVTRGKERILIKPNLVGPSPTFTTKPEVVKTLIRLMQAAKKDVCIGEASCPYYKFRSCSNRCASGFVLISS